MMPYIYPDIYEHILAQLPIEEGLTSDGSVRTLVACAQTCSTMCGVAYLRHLWRPHYLARWTRSCVPTDNLVLQYDGDYRAMYAERRRRDRRAVEALNGVIGARENRHRLSLELVLDLGFDVWDTLRAQKTSFIPLSFHEGVAPSEDWFARDHWVDEIINTMVRRQAVVRAIKLELRVSDMSLEEGLSIFSGFWGVEYSQIDSHFNDLANQCRQHLTAQGHSLDTNSRSFDWIVDVSLEICFWMREQGFVAAIDTYHDMRNHFLHKVLTTHKRTLPLSLVAIFVALCRRLGISASPVGFPGHVHAFLPVAGEVPTRSPWAPFYDAVEGGIHIDVFNSATQPLIDVIQLLRRGQRNHLKPSSTYDMVFRAGRNILTSAQLHQVTLEAWELDLSIYAVFSIFLLPDQTTLSPSREFIEQIMSIVQQNYPLDIGPILQSMIAPALDGPRKAMLEEDCAKAVEKDAVYAIEDIRGPIRYFSGIVFVHRIFDYIAVILEGDDHCHASEGWILRFGIDALERGRRQPFYTVAAADGSSRYVAEDNIIPIARLRTFPEPDISAHATSPDDEILRSLVLGFPGLGRHFLRPVEAPGGRLCFVPHPDMMTRHPDEREKMRLYLQTGEV